MACGMKMIYYGFLRGVQGEPFFGRKERFPLHERGFCKFFSVL